MHNEVRDRAETLPKCYLKCMFFCDFYLMMIFFDRIMQNLYMEYSA